MFPESFIESTNTENTTEEVGVDFVFDYKTGQHTMKNGLLAECTAIQSIQQFIQNVLRTKVKAYKVYIEGETDTFGISVYDYLGQRTLPMGYVNSELKREVTNQLLKHPHITGVVDWLGKRDRRGLDISFTTKLTIGNTSIETSAVLSGSGNTGTNPNNEPDNNEPDDNGCNCDCLHPGSVGICGEIISTVIGETTAIYD